MDFVASLHPTPQTWLRNSALAPHIDAYEAYLRQGRYASVTTRGYLTCVAHFAHWMSQCGLQVPQVDERSIRQFLDQHLRSCNCPCPVVRVYGDLRAALGHLLIVLRAQSAIPKVPEPVGPIADELRRYDDHMCNARGLTAGTRCGQLRIIGRLLLHKFVDRPVVIGKLQPSDVRQFIAVQMKLVDTVSNAFTLASALRSYLRYRSTCGDQIQGLLGAISSPAHWGLASLPRALKPVDVERLLASFTPEVASPLRGYAIVRCALDLGLRSSEVAKLQLTDIDWRAATVTLRSTKSRRQDIFPLPEVTGRALADYLQHERPKTTNSAVFVRTMAPRDKPIGSDAIQKIIRNAYRRIGLNHGRSHALRHTLACQLLEGGSSLKDVADVLRHRSLNTTRIYAKLDNRKLVAVAMPWPGSAT
ncbi:MAG: tyrosine-type recombinase/integrase [Rhodoferax sp.]|uniref:site-specific integrase n=1 Tax=Rhodoferax sp. TaxID=50421 RepID=UPI0013FFA766|nr:site-specific integrase [Rhodoferax sp.]NDP40792.1 tyrosine-type recombinase/integrase [Rhodoferax sp.]